MSLFGQKPAGSTLFGTTQPATGAFGQPSTTGNAFGQTQQPATGGLFGQTQQPAAGTSLFGQPQQQQPAAGGGLFGQQQPAAGGGLFGQTQQPAAGTAPATGLFGQPSAGGGLFGASQPAQQPGTGLFGAAQPAQTGTGLFGASQPAQAGTGLFGASQPAQQQTGGFFGATQQPAASGSNLFGSTSTPLFGAKPAQPAAGGIFANNNTQPQQTSIFGSTSTNPNPLFGSTNNNAGTSMFGANAQQQTQQAPPFTKSTKFNDLPDAIKKTLEDIDSHIQGRIQISKDLHQRKLGDEATKGQQMIRSVHKDLISTTTAIRNDLHFTKDLKAKTDQAVEDTIVATRIVDGFRNPHANAAYLKDHAGFPLEFFTRVVTQIRERLTWYKSTIEQIERKLASSAGQAQYTPQAIHATLQAQHATFLALASKTAAVDAQLQKIKQIYTQLWRAKTGSHRDPFESEGDRADLGFGSLRV